MRKFINSNEKINEGIANETVISISNDKSDKRHEKISLIECT